MQLAVLLAVLLFAGGAAARDAGIEPADAGVEAATEAADAGKPDTELAELARTASRVRALVAGTLDVGVEPAALFDVSLDDERAIRVEVERLRAISEHRLAPASDAGVGDAGTKDAAADAAAAVGGLDPALWSAEVDLARARLAFLALSKKERDSLIASHAARQKNAATSTDAQLSAAEKKGQLADEERLKALDAARRARTEAERMLAEEHARLLEVKGKQADYEADLVRREKALADRHEQFLGLERRVGDARDAAAAGRSDATAADALYEEVRGTLRAARADLSGAASALAAQPEVPRAGEDKLTVLPDDIDKTAVDATRKDVERAAAALSEREKRLRSQRAAKLYEHVLRLNQDRLALLPLLTPVHRQAVTGFGAAGLDQARAELRQVVVVLHYHLVLTRLFVSALRTPAGRGGSVWNLGLSLGKLLLPVLVFVWWRRRAPRLLDGLRQAIRGGEPGQIQAAPASPAERALTFFEQIRAPLEWLVLLFALLRLLPPAARGLLEVQLAATIFAWTFGGALVVQGVDALAGQDRGRRMRKSRLLTAHVRLRSLRLVGRVVVVIALVLAITNQIVGKGTIYGWVLGLCWVAAIPIALVLLRWWRAIIFERISLKRRKNRVEELISASADGWKSYPAAAAGAAVLTAARLIQLLRAWIGRFDLTRRLLAYLFRREISKTSEAAAAKELGPLPSACFEALGPEVASRDLVPSEADEQVDEIIRRIRLPGGGVFAVVGERGSGKTTVLERLVREAQGVEFLRCPFGGMRAFAPALLEALGASKEARLEEVAKNLDQDDRNGGVLVDDAHRLIRPMMGGLVAFDRVLSLARSYSQNLSWVFAFDESIWRFFERMRGARPTFDDVIQLRPWSEDAIVRLLGARSKLAGATASFARLVEQLEGDDIDYEEAEERTAASYYRLIWDHANGNPGAALHAWRRSLGTDSDGHVVVRAFEPPAIDELEALPDNSVFVLRAVVQLERAQPLDLCNATGIGASEVEDALRFGLARGYFKRSDDGYRVTWHWFRTVTRFLERRHLLFRER